MASLRYAAGLEGIGDRTVDMLGGDIRVALVSSAYTPNALTHKFLSDITGIVARTPALTGKTFTGGVFDADDATAPTVTGAVIVQLVGFLHTGSDATARLIWLNDTGTGLPFTPSGSNVPIAWDNASNKIFSL